MTDGKKEYLALLGTITLLPMADQDKIVKFQKEIQSILDAEPDLGLIALTLVGYPLMENA